MNALSPDALARAQTPLNVRLTKSFLRADVDQLANEFNSVKSLGSATVDEWLKGLEDRGKQRRSDPSRWTKWAGSEGVMALQTLLYPEVSVPAATSLPVSDL